MGDVGVDPQVCHGRACIRGTRVMVSVVPDNLAAGVPRDEILSSYPSLRPEDIEASLSYTAELARECSIPLPITRAAGLAKVKSASSPRRCRGRARSAPCCWSPPSGHAPPLPLR
ncbi:MAG: DUF433 domain-containing protein [Armatimonadetes bacterium]|nr:DUF433 domain-containing protein [Armatimonadota bacterium]